MIYKEEQNFLGDELRQELLDYVLSQEANFTPTLVGSGDGQVDIGIRISSQLTQLGKFREIFERKSMDNVDLWIKQLGVNHFEPTAIEVELVAHGDGAFYSRHIDLLTGQARHKNGEDRIITMVYYFHREPKAFTGGQLRVFPKFGLQRTDQSESCDIEPAQDKAVIFSSWAAHEVLKVECPSRRFADSRFAVNCWVLAQRG